MIHHPSQDHAVRRARFPRSKRMRYCAVLVDFENIYSTLAEPAPQDDRMDDTMVDEQALDDCVELLSNLRGHLRDKYNCVMAIGRSYADFDRLGGDAQSQLQLLAFEPRFMLAAKQKSSADILLSIDAMEMLLTRPELEMFAIVGGDLDYLPVVRRLREHLKRVVLVGFNKSTSGDLRQVVGEENFVSADILLPDGSPASTEGNGRGRPERESEREDEDYDDDYDDRGNGGYYSQESQDEPAKEEHLEECMAELLGAYYQYGGRTVWLTPFLRILNDRFPYLDNRGRKRLVEDLQSRGAISIDKVEGDPYPYSVVEINWENAWVKTMDENRGNE